MTYEAKNAMPAPFNPNVLTKIQVKPRFAMVQATSVITKMAWRFFATMMYPMGQVITRSAMPRQIQRKSVDRFEELGAVEEDDHERGQDDGGDDARTGQ